MRTSLLVTAACAAVAFAKPVPEEVVITQVDVAYVTDIVTVTAGQPQPTTTPAGNGKHRKGRKGHKHAATTTEAPQQYTTPEAPQQYTTPEAPAPTTPESTPEASAPPSSQAPDDSTGSGQGYSTATTYKQSVVNSHNYCRRHHGSPDAAWDDDLYQSALQFVQSCKYEHKMDINGGGYGQNLAAGPPPENISNAIIDMFYTSEAPFYSNNYGLASPPMGDQNKLFEQWGHMTQVVWKASTKVACASYNCKGGILMPNPNSPGEYTSSLVYGTTLTACHYREQGNYAGEFAANVGTCSGALGVTGDQYVDKSAILASWQGMGS